MNITFNFLGVEIKASGKFTPEVKPNLGSNDTAHDGEPATFEIDESSCDAELLVTAFHQHLLQRIDELFKLDKKERYLQKPFDLYRFLQCEDTFMLSAVEEAEKNYGDEPEYEREDEG